MGEAVVIEAALLATRRNHQLAAKRLGYGRNELTRKIETMTLPVRSKPQLFLQHRW
ncbi:helix-turn-helix domain-containing protein [Methyloterricola oryzae]|uniref:helix-turn-helix domain-containing protein n=1 Tax=Methyloterricola oryzae TaxID=1495050 RepID=UPI0009E3C997|nr:helix-turn-helix domain-containing protein [Methyloterricola oryzae]